MKRTKDLTRMKQERGITLISLIITIALMLIISSITVYTSFDRFEVNNLNKMYNDIKLLSDKVSNYYLKYDGIPVLRDNNNNPIEYIYTQLNFEKNVKDSDKYYILDLEAMNAISLNYGEEGFKAPDTSDDIYIINEYSRIIYYVRGIEVDNIIYYTLPDKGEQAIDDNIPPTKPQIKIISGEKDIDDKYITDIELEFVPGIEKISNIDKTTYSINNGVEESIDELTNNIYKITEDGTYEIKLKTYDTSGNISETTQNFIRKTIKIDLDKTTINKEIETGTTETETITAVLTNIEGEPDWISSDSRVAQITGEGDTKTIILKNVGNAVITVKYKTCIVECNVTVTEKQLVEEQVIVENNENTID